MLSMTVVQTETSNKCWFCLVAVTEKKTLYTWNRLQLCLHLHVFARWLPFTEKSDNNSFSLSSLPLRADKTGGSVVWHSQDTWLLPISSPYSIWLYSTAAYLNISRPVAWCVRHIVVTPITGNGIERKMLLYKTSGSCLSIEERTDKRVPNIILFLQCGDGHCAEGKMLYPLLPYVIQHLIVFPILNGVIWFLWLHF